MSTCCSTRKPETLVYRSAASYGSTVPGWWQMRSIPPGRGNTTSTATPVAGAILESEATKELATSGFGRASPYQAPKIAAANRTTPITPPRQLVTQYFIAALLGFDLPFLIGHHS